MKIFYFILTLCLFSSLSHAGQLTSEDARAETEQVEIWTAKFAEALSMPEGQQLDTLYPSLRNLGYWKSIPGHSAQIDNLFSKIQAHLLSLPGHAQHIADQLELQRSNLQQNTSRIDYDRQRQWLIVDTLKYLPSPETVKVLGNYLDDNRDFVAETVLSPGAIDTEGGRSNTSTLAVAALKRLGIENGPAHDPKLDDNRNVGVWRFWYQQIKSGEIPLSFEGQESEYRFAADGTGQTVAQSEKRAEVPAVKDRIDKHKKDAPSFNPWLPFIGGITVLIAVILVYRARSTDKLNETRS